VVPADLEGRDLIGERPRTGDEGQFVMETHPSETKARPSYALRTGDEKVILRENRRREAYDLRTDPGERHDLTARKLPLYTTLHEDLILDLEQLPLRDAVTVDTERGGIDDATREALRSLGYVDP
ncbi:hypothetical protein K8I85_16335, partial [bacterium]|nr:hypothetical protein [bacterium]